MEEQPRSADRRREAEGTDCGWLTTPPLDDGITSSGGAEPSSSRVPGFFPAAVRLLFGVSTLRRLSPLDTEGDVTAGTGVQQPSAGDGGNELSEEQQRWWCCRRLLLPCSRAPPLTPPSAIEQVHRGDISDSGDPMVDGLAVTVTLHSIWVDGGVARAT